MPPAGWRCEILEDTPSTMDVAWRHARAGDLGNLAILAHTQSAGRGRRQRAWISPPGNLYCSLLLREAGAGLALPQLSFVAALAVAGLCMDLVPDPRRVRLKWPNDVLLDGRKVAGLLLEAESDQPDTLVLGIGVNVMHYPPDTEFPATSLAAHGAPAMLVEGVLERLLQHFQDWRDRWRQTGFAPVRAAWLQLAQGLEGPMRARLPEAEIEGIFLGLAEDGALRLRLADGTVRHIAAGDVFFARSR